MTFKFIIDPDAQESAADDTSTSQQSGIDDETLFKIGKRISQYDLEKLATTLEVPHYDLRNYKETNFRTSAVTNEGTITMLFDWRGTVGILEQRRKLREALKAAKLIQIQEEFLP